MPAVHYHETKFPPPDLEWRRLIPLLGPASAGLARYEGILHAVPNAAVLLSPLTTREAVLSSKIEGTQATMGEVLEYEAGARSGPMEPAKDADIQEVLNYRRALHRAEQLLRKLPICGRLLRGVHKVLMQGVRGRNKTPGEFRKVSNWIGPSGCSEKDAAFVTIAPENLPHAIANWEKYANSQASDLLVQLAILHVEFEAIHPFLDGNGRLGRLLIPLFLYHKGLLSRPMFYMSAYLEAHREAYYERLRAVSSDDDWTGWVEFFLKAVIMQARTNEDKARKILSLYEGLKDLMVDMTHSQYGVRALDVLFSKPILNSTDFITSAEIPQATARRILRVFRDHGLLKTIRQGRGRQTGVYAFGELINITEGAEMF